jgi:Domain of unknown function (DUF1823)
MATPELPLPPLTLETVQAVLDQRLEDHTVNRLVWQQLGYRYDAASGSWDSTAVAAAWRDKYPEPPNFIESRPATVQLTRAIAPEHKQLLKQVLGFKGYTVDQLVPRLTRRATMANWLLAQLQAARPEAE